MNITPEQLLEVENFASMLMSVEEISKALDLDHLQFARQVAVVNSPIHNAFYRGYLKTVAKHNSTVVNLANQGSSPAQNMLKKMRVELKIDSIKKRYGW